MGFFIGWCWLKRDYARWNAFFSKVCLSEIEIIKIINANTLIINSDIVISHLPEFKKDGITIFSRFDYTTTYENSQVYEHGFDAFFIPKEFRSPPSLSKVNK